ncbi:copper resistance CopC/CopD family protein [Streptomyces avermitilis]|uniref:copper resistance CopC/CopD family protein n=1 Tax=Streptomyces avermitilis TaxID=33903 RepID=UPI0036984EE1
MGGQRNGGRVGRAATLLGTVVLLILFGSAGSAFAHAALKGADPVDGTVLKKAPAAITLTFTESVGLLDDSFRVLDPENRRVHIGEPQHAGGRSETARVTLPDDMGTGTFTVGWRVVSADSHPVSGALTFSIGKPSATTAVIPTQAAGDTASATLYDIARYFAYGGLALLLGTMVFSLVTGVEAARGLLLTGWWTLLASTIALLLLRGPYERGGGPAAAFDPSVLAETATSRPGVTLLVRLVLLAGAAFFPVRAGGRWWKAGGALLTLALAGTWAVAEHASAGIQVPVAMVSAVLHLLAMAAWLGGLAALLTALYRAPEELPASAVTRFSRLALTAVTVLVATGVYQSWRGLGSLDALTTTSYGRLLVAKLVAVLLLLAAATYSRRWTARLAAPVERRADVRERVLEPVGAAADAEVSGTDMSASTGAGTDTSAGTGAGTDMSADTGAGTGTDSGAETGTDTETGSGSDTATETGPQSGPLPSTGGGDPGAYRRGLRRSVLAEVVVAIVVLVITTLLTGTQPGRAATEAAASAAEAARPMASTTVIPFDVGTPGGHGKIQIELTPGRVGENSVQAVIFGPDGGLATVPELRLTFTLEKQHIGPLDAKLADRGGYWTSDTLNLPLPGTWTMKATVRTTDIDQITVSRTVRIE